MEKQKIIVFVSIIIIVSIVSYSLLNVYVLTQLELGGIDNFFRFFEMSTVNGKINICNNSFIPANFNQFSILVYFERELLGTFVVSSANIVPDSIFEAKGTYTSQSMAQSQNLFMHFDHLFSNSDNTVRIDPRKMDIVSQFQTTIVGIPYSVSERYTSFDFWNMLNDETNVKC